MWGRGREKGKITSLSGRKGKILGKDDVVAKSMGSDEAKCLI